MTEHYGDERDARYEEAKEARERASSLAPVATNNKIAVKLAEFLAAHRDGQLGHNCSEIEDTGSCDICPLLSDAINALSALAPVAPDLTELREAWEEGFWLCRGYGDNWIHFDGAQKERQWASFLLKLAARDRVAPPSPSVMDAVTRLWSCGASATGSDNMPFTCPAHGKDCDLVCQHGTAMDVHCCACRRRGFFPPDDCDCYRRVAPPSGSQNDEYPDALAQSLPTQEDRISALTAGKAPRTEDEIARYYWPKDSQPSEEPAQWFRAAISDAFDSGISFAVRRGVNYHPEDDDGREAQDNTPEGEALTALVAEWRSNVEQIGPRLEGAAFEQCANQLEALLTARASSPPSPVSPQQSGAHMQFRKKPVVIEAIQWTGANVDAVLGFIVTKGSARREPSAPHAIYIDTLEGTMRADKGDWIICGVKGEFYPCKPDIFTATYDPVPPSASGPST